MEFNLPIQTDDAIYPLLPTEVYSKTSLKSLFKLILITISLFVVLNIVYHFYRTYKRMTR